MKYSLIAGLLAVAGASSKPTSHVESESVNVETLRTVPQGWTAIGAPAGHRKLPFRIAVRSVGPLLMLVHKRSCIPAVQIFPRGRGYTRSASS